MTLFDTNGGPAEELLGGGSSAVLYRGVLSAEDAEDARVQLMEDVPWEQPPVRVFGKEYPQPRLVAWYGDPGATYSYSGTTLNPLPWTATISRLRSLCEAVARQRFNSVLVNLYRDGMDSVSWHSDDEAELGPDPVIASLSLGAERRFDLRNKATRQKVQAVLAPGSVLVMSGHCQHDWQHQIAKTKKVTKPRINLTFRTIHDR